MEATQPSQKIIGTAMGIVSRVTTTVDGSLRVTLDIPPEGNKEVIPKLLDLALNPKVIWVSFVQAKV